MEPGYGKNMADSGDDKLFVDGPVNIASFTQDETLGLYSLGSGISPSQPKGGGEKE